MKLYFLAILLGISLSMRGKENPDSLFVSANRQYTAEKYDDAIQQYLALKAFGYESAELYYNIGNAYYKLKQYPKAILNYERALLINPGNEDIKYNLAKAKMYNIDRIDEIPEFIIKHWSIRIITLFTSNTWALISICTFAVSLTSLLLFFLSGRILLSKTSFYSGLFLILLSLGSCYFSYKAKSLIFRRSGAIVSTPTVTIKSTPSESGVNLFILHEGTKVFVIGHLDTWNEIRLSDGKQGWMHASDLEAI
jgi:tetratricopeptide (TPR) repeat protein